MITAKRTLRRRISAGRRTCTRADLGLSHYRLAQVIGQGGMGIVYRASAVASCRPCAVKIMRPEIAARPVNVQRFNLEIGILRRLSHRNIVTILDSGFDGCRHYFAMEYVAGRNLDDLVRANGRLPSNFTVALIRAVCSALADVHALGIVHNDIKPANLIVPSPGCDAGGIKLIDFGLAQAIRQDDRVVTPGDGAFNGSPLYAPPESYSGIIDQRSDIYSLGAMAYHLLAGRPVFDEDRPLAAIMAHVAREPISLLSVRPSIHPALSAIVMKCLRKDPRDRFQSVDELGLALAHA